MQRTTVLLLALVAVAGASRPILGGATLNPEYAVVHAVPVADANSYLATTLGVTHPVPGLTVRLDKAVEVADPPTYPLCSLCVQLMLQGLNYLLNAILDRGIVAGCAELCSNLPEKLEAEACNVVCDAAGVAGFIEVRSRRLSDSHVGGSQGGA
jgi:hypothetical protein